MTDNSMWAKKASFYKAKFLKWTFTDHFKNGRRKKTSEWVSEWV